MEYILSPSILAADFGRLGEEVKKTEDQGAAYLHCDIMDGVFVPNISYGPVVVKALRRCTSQLLDVHLMITEPLRYVEAFAQAGADILTVHVEACQDVAETLRAIRGQGMRRGITLRPGTPLEAIYPYLDQVEMVLVMAVEPGFGGQSFLPGTLERIRTLRKKLERTGRKVDLQVDGGIYLSNAREVLGAGANILVSGSGIFRGDAAENTARFMEILREYA